jgi:hypothetical protein
VMVARLLMASSRPQGLPAKWVAAGRAASSWVESASTEVEVEAAAQAQADAVEAWKSIDRLS